MGDSLWVHSYCNHDCSVLAFTLTECGLGGKTFLTAVLFHQPRASPSSR